MFADWQPTESACSHIPRMSKFLFPTTNMGGYPASVVFHFEIIPTFSSIPGICYYSKAFVNRFNRPILFFLFSTKSLAAYFKLIASTRS